MNLVLNHVFQYILIVDDDKNDHITLRRAIHQVMPEAIVESLYDSSEALEYLNKCTSFPNLILLDRSMVEISGRTTMEVIRENRHMSTVPVIVLSADAEKQEPPQSGPTGFYSKPQRPAELVQLMQAIRHRWLS